MAGLILVPDYDDIQTCSSCQTENVGCKKFEAEKFLPSPERYLCYICASTFISTHQTYRHLADIAPITQSVAQVANIILKVIKGIPLETETPEASK